MQTVDGELARLMNHEMTESQKVCVFFDSHLRENRNGEAGGEVLGVERRRVLFLTDLSQMVFKNVQGQACQ